MRLAPCRLATAYATVTDQFCFQLNAHGNTRAVRCGVVCCGAVWCGVVRGVVWRGGGVASRRVACNATGVWGSDHERRLVIANYQSRNLSVARGRESSHLQMKGQRAAAL